MREPKIIDFSFVVDEELAERFKRVAIMNGTTAKEVLAGFI